MNSKVFLILRILFGIYLLFFGFDHFFNYIPFPAMAPEANAYFANLLSTGTMQLTGIVEIVAGLAFMFNRFGALMAFILMGVSINAVLFHVSLDPDKVWGALFLLLLNIYMLYAYRDQYREIVRP